MIKDIEILYEDKDIIVCRKPAGIAVQSANIRTPDMESMLKSMLSRRCGERGTVRANDSFVGRSESGIGEIYSASGKEVRRKGDAAQIYIIHRLDQPVEGIVVFGKNKKAAASLSKQVQSEGGMNKIYLAAVYGILPEKEGELRDYLIKDRASRCAVVTDKSHKDAKEAILSYKVIQEKDVLLSTSAGNLGTDEINKESDLSRGEEESFEVNYKSNPKNFISIIQIQLKTGRFHQIRAQFSHLGYPLLGDRRYGNNESNELSSSLGLKNVALCAYKLSFIHPTTGKTMEYEITPLSDIFSGDGF